MKTKGLKTTMAAACCMAMMASCQSQQQTNLNAQLSTPGNPYMPLWEHIPDGEPYVFEDPDQPGKQRVYVYGSHDDLIDAYCGRDQVVWSASVDSLNNWRYDGVILVVDKNAKGEPFDSAGTADVLFAPDVTLVTDANGKKTYYLFPNDQTGLTGFRNGLIAKSDRPDGPFEVCNWNAENPNQVDGVLQFDPAVFVDDDGRVYGYWGFERSYAAEFDPTTMATVKPGTKVVEDMVSGRNQDGVFSFFEASSIRKIKDKYVFIYSRFTKDGEFGMPTSNYTLAYAYSDNPLGPWTYGGTIIDGRAREKDEQGNAIASATPDGNTHGSICEINGQWYHRQTGTNEYARQAMVAPIDVKVEEGKGGKVVISEGEYTSEGFALNGLNPLERHSAGIACWYTGPKPATHEWPNNTFYGSYVEAGYGTDSNFAEPYALKNNTNRVVNNTAGSIVGYKYFNFNETNGKEKLQLALRLIPEGIDGTIQVMADRPWTSQGGKLVGTIALKADMPKSSTELTVTVPEIAKLTGKHAIFFVFQSDTKEKSLCTLEDFVFTD